MKGSLQARPSPLGAGQVLADLVIALCLVMVWMWRNATATGRNPWPWIVLTLAAGSCGPVIYLLTQPQDKSVALTHRRYGCVPTTQVLPRREA